MMVVVNLFKCTGCSFCVPVCPNRAIKSQGKAEIDQECCVACLECLDFCPTMALGQANREKDHHEG